MKSIVSGDVSPPERSDKRKCFHDDIIIHFQPSAFCCLASSENSLVSERSQPYILKVSQIMEVLNNSKNCVMRWSVRCETGEFSQRKGCGRPSKLSKILAKN